MHWPAEREAFVLHVIHEFKPLFEQVKHVLSQAENVNEDKIKVIYLSKMMR